MCIPEPLCPDIGFGMNVARTPCCTATCFTIDLNSTVLSAVVSGSVGPKLISS